MTFVSVVCGQRGVSLSSGHDDTIQKRTSVTSPFHAFVRQIECPLFIMNPAMYNEAPTALPWQSCDLEEATKKGLLLYNESS